MAQPVCGLAPKISPLTGCMDVQVGVPQTFNISAVTLCDPTISDIIAIDVVTAISGMTEGNLTTSTTNSSISYLQFTWTPQISQLGSQTLCVIASTE